MTTPRYDDLFDEEIRDTPGGPWPAPWAELPWLGDIDRRDDDDVEFCDEGDWE